MLSGSFRGNVANTFKVIEFHQNLLTLEDGPYRVTAARLKLLHIGGQVMPTTEGNLSKFIWHLVVPLLIALLILFVEYRSGWFHESSLTKSGWPLQSHFLTALTAAVVLMTLISAIEVVLIWLRPYRHVREDFSFGGLLFIVFLSVTFVLSSINGVMPWSAVSIVSERLFFWVAPPYETTKWTDYALMLVLYIIAVWVVVRNRARWSGAKSIDQYQQEQRSEFPSLFLEGSRELQRIIRRQPALERYAERSAKDFITQLEPVSDSLAWRDQAKDLLRLSSSSYAFDPDSSWYDKEGCWVGSNVNTNDLVILFPFQKEPTDGEVDACLKHSERISKQRKTNVGEIVVAIRGVENSRLALAEMRLRYTTEKDLLDNLIDFKDYFNDIKKRAATLTLPDSELVLTQVYVPSMFQHSEGVSSSQNIEQYLDEWTADPRQKHLALLGEYGQGKSTAALMWAYHQIVDGPIQNKRIPLVIELRGTSPRNLTPLTLLGAWSARYNLNPQALMRLLIAGRLTLIFEGFDEMTLVGDAGMRLNHFRTLWQFAYPKAKLLITGRPNFFLDEEEMKAALGINRPVANAPYCEAIRLVPFNPDQIYKALRAYGSAVREQIHDLAIKNPRFRDIVSRPSLLHIVSVLWEREHLSDKVDQLTSAFVMDLFVRQSYRRQGAKEEDSSGFMALTTAEREYFMEGIAAYMGSRDLPNQISSRQLNHLIKDLLQVIPDSISAQSSAILGETNQPLRTRIRKTEHGVEHVLTDVRACGLLVDDPSSPGTFRFGHKSFMEYLFAVVIADAIQRRNVKKNRAILRVVNSRVEDILNLSVAVEFLCELLVISAQSSGRRNTSKADLARQLLQMILGETTMTRSLRRLAASQEIMSYCVSTIIFRRQPSHMMVRRMTMMLLLVPMTLLMMPFMLGFFRIVQMPSPARRLAVLATGVAGMTLTFAMMMSFMVAMPLRMRVELWLRVCKGLNIEDSVLHRALGTALIPKIREQSLYRYLEEDNEDHSPMGANVD